MQGSHMRESDIQKAFVKWARSLPEDIWVHSIPNAGHRSYRLANHEKALGLRAGVADIFIPLGRMGYHGLYIEFKAKKGILSEPQREFQKHCLFNNYLYSVQSSVDGAIRVVSNYLGLISS